MDLIFNNGKNLYFKQHPAEVVEKIIGTKLHDYQKNVINGNNNDNVKIYGDDFLVEFIPKNVAGQFALSIKDYDENQKKECEINIGFSEQELKQVMDLLKYYYDTWVEN